LSVLAEKLNNILAELRRIPDVPSVLIVRKDGTVIAANTPGKTNQNKVASMVAGIASTSELAVGELDQGEFQEVLVETQDGRVLGVGAGEDAILVALVKKESNIGLILLTLKKYAAEVARIVSSEKLQELIAVDGSVSR